ncbi:vacuolar-type H+-ATPase subunit I/STV1 [Methanobacterium oryzae]
MEEKNKQIKNEEKLNESRIHKMRVIKDRKRVEMEYLDAIKRQMGYWKGQIDTTDPKDADRYNELKSNIESEKEHMKQVQKELNRINEEIKVQIKR